MLAALAVLSSCRAVIGYRSIDLDDAGDSGASVTDARSPDGASDAGRDARADVTVDASKSDAPVDASACPTSPPTPLFSTTLLLSGLFLGTARVYSETVNTTFSLDYEPYSGLVTCPKAGCSLSPEVVFQVSSLDSGVGWGSAAASDAGLFYSLPTVSPDGGYQLASRGMVEGAAFDGGNAQTVASHLAYPFLLAAVGDTAYWVDDPEDLSITGDASPEWSVRAARVGGSPLASTLFSQGFPSGAVFGLFTDAKNVYVYGCDAVGALGLFVCPLLGGADGGGCGGRATELIPNLAYPQNNVPNDSFAADGVAVFQASAIANSIIRYDLATHQPTTIAANLASPANLVLSGAELLWSTGSGVVYHMPKDGSRAPAPIACGLTNVAAVASDGVRVYFLADDPIHPGQTEVASVPFP